MIKRFYNPWQITNPGEKEADKLLTLPAGLAGEEIYVHYHLRLSSKIHRVQMTGECDFVFITRLGVLVLEVKGGIMGFGDTGKERKGFYRLAGDNEKVPERDPFDQVDANAAAIQDFLRTKPWLDIFVGKAVCFSECAFRTGGPSIDYLWHRDHKKGLVEFVLDSLAEQVSDYNEKQKQSNYVEKTLKFTSLRRAKLTR